MNESYTQTQSWTNVCLLKWADMEAMASRLRSRTLSVDGSGPPSLPTLHVEQLADDAQQSTPEANPLTESLTVATTVALATDETPADEKPTEAPTNVALLQPQPSETASEGPVAATAERLVTSGLPPIKYITWPPCSQGDSSLEGVTVADSVAEVASRIAAQQGVSHSGPACCMLHWHRC